MKKLFAGADIDIDVANRKTILKKLPHVAASIKDKDGNLTRHNSGVYFSNIPVDPRIDASSIDYKSAKDYGYFKFDFLNVSFYKNIKSEKHLDKLMSKEPEWNMLQNIDYVEKLYHISKHFDLVKTLKPNSVEKLAALLAIIRPAKAHLRNKTWDEILKSVWIKNDNDDYQFKKSHATAYALLIVVQMNWLKEQETALPKLF